MLCFDLDGTLIDSNGIWEEVDRQFLGRHGLVETEEYDRTVGHSIFPIAAQFTVDYYHLDMTAQEVMDQWLLLAGDAYAHVPMKEGARDFLEKCRQKGERMALITACVPAMCHTALEHHGIKDWFEQVVFAQNLGLEKKDPEVFRIAARRFEAAPEDCVLYEDAPANCAAAKTAGYTVVGVYDRFYRRYQEEMKAVCDRYITSFLEL